MLFPYLGLRDELTERVRCPIHGFIHYSQKEKEVINHPAFQRLRNIRQLALSYYLYPGATHSRFEHSLGVMELSTKAFEILATKHRDRLMEELRQVPEFREKTLENARQALRMLALLHDVGHPAFSHAAESVLPTNDQYIQMLPGTQKHEQVSVYVINEVLRGLLEQLFFPGITDVLVRAFKRSPELTFLRKFVVGELDMDRTDYLLRDSLHCGVEYGKFDYRRLIESLTVLTHPDSGRLQLGIERGGEHTFEALILARYQMSTQIYYHRLRRIYDAYLIAYMKLWGEENYHSFSDVLRFDDLRVLVQIEDDALSFADSDRTRLAKRIFFRQHHRLIYETGDSADHIKLGRAKRILRSLKEQFKDIDFHLDDAKASIHKVTFPGQQDGDKVEDFFIVEKDGNLRLITEDSAILEKIPKEFRNVRIFADAPTEMRAQISKVARDAERMN